MSIRKTLGGDRLGSGKKMKVELHGFERSNHDLSYLWRNTMAPGTLVPFICEVALPGDTFDINLNSMALTHPTIGPLFGTFKLQCDVFQAPMRLYNALLHNNQLGIGLNMKNVKLPQLRLTATQTSTAADIDNSQIHPSCIFNYLGIRGVGRNNSAATTRDFNGIPYLAYVEIYKNYYSNKQEEIGAVIHTPFAGLVNTVTAVKLSGTTIPQNSGTAEFALGSSTTITIAYTGNTPNPSQILLNTTIGTRTAQELFKNLVVNTALGEINGQYDIQRWGAAGAFYWRYAAVTDPYGGKPVVATFPLADIDSMRMKLLAAGSTPVVITNAETLLPYKWVIESSNGRPNMMNNQEGLLLKTYQSDQFNNWLKTEWIDGPTGINTITAIDTSSGKFTIDTLNLTKKVYDMLNRIAVSGGSYNDWLDAVYAHERFTQPESPIYHGGLINEIVFQEVISNSGNTDQPLGTLAGRGILGNKHKGGNIVIKVDEPSYIIGIVSITPRLDYSQGNKWDVNLQTLDDLHKPNLDEIGFQELLTEQLAFWGTSWNGSAWTKFSAGKQPAWINYMTNVNQVKGNFAIASNEMFMVLNRRYEDAGASIKDLTTYIDPSKYNHIFADTSLDAQNFWIQISVDMFARRKMSAKVMPNL